MPTVSVGNIKNKPRMKQHKVEADCHTLTRMGTVALACELGPKRYKKAFRQAAHTRGLYAPRVDRAVQVAVAQSWAVGATHTIRLTRGLPGVNPSRWITCVEVPGEHFGPTVFMATHWTNGAWNFKRKPFKRWRKKRWLRQEAKARRLVGGLVAQGWNVVIGGDFNTGPMRSHVNLHPNQHLVERAGLMHLYAIPTKGYTTKVLGRRVERDVHTDHPFLRAFIHFQKDRTR